MGVRLNTYTDSVEWAGAGS